MPQAQENVTREGSGDFMLINFFSVKGPELLNITSRVRGKRSPIFQRARDAKHVSFSLMSLILSRQARQPGDSVVSWTVL